MLRALQYSDHPQGRTRLRPVAQRSALPGLIAARGIGRWRCCREKYREALTFHRIKTRARAQVSSICETIQLRNPHAAIRENVAHCFFEYKRAVVRSDCTGAKSAAAARRTVQSGSSAGSGASG